MIELHFECRRESEEDSNLHNILINQENLAEIGSKPPESW